ncbi:hypothetical protein [Marinobacter oulmenensis]|uniref:Uncharacterized protein n=1 Tax=Marinobacter oulmenensis TaxID=643747 RepID=A0A840U703_9GAMM|nr:hypothetical protein [Marinobacter oulmenensis]MBB5319973.1 hypothetical protein [Marinobacter oulmenensis]
MSNYDEVEDAIQDARDTLESAPNVVALPLSFISGSQKLKELIGTKSAPPTKFRKSDSSITIDNTFLLRNIQIETTSPIKQFSSEFEITIKGIEGSSETIKPDRKTNDGKIFIFVNKVVTELTISAKGKAKLKNRPEISGIEIYGYTESDFESIADYASQLLTQRTSIVDFGKETQEEIERTENEIQDNELRKQEIEQEIAVLSDQKKSSDLILEELNTKISEITQTVAEKEESLLTASNKLTNIENSIEVKSDERSKLISETNDLKSDLQRLIEDKNTFSSELSDYISEGEKNIKKYYALASIPVVIMATLTIILISNSIDLLHTETSLNGVISTVISRLPFTLVTIGLITASFKICKFFISEMTRIYDERLAMTKLSIIAKEVSNSVFDDVNDPEIKYALRAQLKMDLLKQYMKNEIGGDFQLSRIKETGEDYKTSGEDEDGDLSTATSRQAKDIS